jgi:hypothetical protein
MPESCNEMPFVVMNGLLTFPEVSKPFKLLGRLKLLKEKLQTDEFM